MGGFCSGTSYKNDDLGVPHSRKSSLYPQKGVPDLISHDIHDAIRGKWKLEMMLETFGRPPGFWNIAEIS